MLFWCESLKPTNESIAIAQFINHCQYRVRSRLLWFEVFFKFLIQPKFEGKTSWAVKM